jgi:hypothetical protein
MKTTPVAVRLSRYFFAAFLLSTLGSGTLAAAAEPQPVPMQQLLADPQGFEGKRVRVVGFLRLEFGRNALYLDRNDFNTSVLEHALRLELTDSQLRSSSKLNNGRVLVEGVFNAESTGQVGVWPGSLKHIVRLHMWRNYRRK